MSQGFKVKKDGEKSYKVEGYKGLYVFKGGGFYCHSTDEHGSIIDFAKVYQNLGFGEAITQITGIEPYSHERNSGKTSQNGKSFSNSENFRQKSIPKFDNNYRLKVEEVEPVKKDEIKLPEKDETDKNYSEIKKYLVDERCLDIDIVNDLIANGGKNGTGRVVLHLIFY